MKLPTKSARDSQESLHVCYLVIQQRQIKFLLIPCCCQVVTSIQLLKNRVCLVKKKKSSTKQDMVIFTTFWQLLGFRKAEKKTNIALTSPAEVELNQPTLRFPPEQLCLSEMSTQLKLKSAATQPSCRCTVYSTHTRRLQLSSRLNHHSFHSRSPVSGNGYWRIWA